MQLFRVLDAKTNENYYSMIHPDGVYYIEIPDDYNTYVYNATTKLAEVKVKPETKKSKKTS